MNFTLFTVSCPWFGTQAHLSWVPKLILGLKLCLSSVILSQSYHWRLSWRKSFWGYCPSPQFWWFEKSSKSPVLKEKIDLCAYHCQINFVGCSLSLDTKFWVRDFDLLSAYSSTGCSARTQLDLLVSPKCPKADVTLLRALCLGCSGNCLYFCFAYIWRQFLQIFYSFEPL